ncbi:hypothetical protein CCMA1212_009594 [Trichoderma ghanense]|uniref:Uncharacterized protein n=1 Tax=Trichoderma ghanense TaxID=65468 RepID=A0ABY2GSL5_9HYPO
MTRFTGYLLSPLGFSPMLCIYRKAASFAGGVEASAMSDFWNQCSKYFLRDTTRCEENNGQFLTEPTLFTGIGRPPTSVLPRLLLVVASGQTSVTVGRNISEAEFYRGKELTGGRKVSVYLDNLIPSRNNALPTYIHPHSAASLLGIADFNHGLISSSAPVRPIMKIIQGKARRGASIYDGGENAEKDCGRVLDNQRKWKKSGECCRQSLRQIFIPPPWPAEQAKHEAPVYHGSRGYQQQKHFAGTLSSLEQDRMPLVSRRPGFTPSNPLLNCFGMMFRVAVNPQAAKVWHIGYPLSSRSVAC